MNDTQLSRRRFLAGSGVGLGAMLLGTGTVAAERPERYIVGTDSPQATRAAEQAADAVHRVLDFGDIGSAVAGTFPEAALDGLRNRPDVRYIERDGTMEAISLDSKDNEVPWGVDRVDAEKAHAGGATGAGADIAIIDTGIDSDHPDLAENLGTGTAFVKARGSYAEPWDDDNGHGTHCAGTAGARYDGTGTGVVGVSTEATLHAVKVLDKNGSGRWSDVAAGIEYVGTQGWDVGSMSIGGGRSQTIEDACDYAFNDCGVLLVAAAGNESEDVATSAPAAYETVMAVSATDKNDDLASFSNYGDEIELAAPGVSITSTYTGGGYATLSGTSMACPHVAGAAGLLLASGYTADDTRGKLTSTAEDIGLSGTEQGEGLLDAEAGVGSVDSAPTVSWTTPTDGETVHGSTDLTIAATDDEDATGTLDVEWRVDGETWDTASATASDDYTGSWDTTGTTDGEHTLEARATDSGGNTATAAVTVTVDNVNDAPTLDWVTPATGDTVGGTTTVELAAGDDRTADDSLTVEWRVGEGTMQTASYDSGTGTYLDDWDTTTVDDGDYTLTAEATDGSGTTTSASVTVTVDNTSAGPSATIDTVTQPRSPNPHAEFEVSWTASGTDLSTVDLSLRQTAPSTESEEAVTIDVSGESVSDTTTLLAKKDDATGNTYDVTMTVTDASGEVETMTSVTEDGE